MWSLSGTLIAGAVATQAARLRDLRQRARLRTVTPLLQGTMRVTVAVLALLLVLAELGVGEVEEMGIRMLRLRDLDGTVHLIPYSEIGRVSNLTKDYAFALLDVRVAYAARVDTVIDELVDIAASLRADPDFGALILEEMEVLGVNALADSGVEIRTRLKTLPLERWRIARELRRRIKVRFDEAGIEIPYPHHVLEFARDRPRRQDAPHRWNEPSAVLSGPGDTDGLAGD